ncbi:MAG: RNA 2',3'-cyclic phosphodiesterase [Candidatus Omnitrophica bacterium]|nr:RNA 2',3'-cyclic phosphodiesterase [Candidatus Omnitrophota bacterium]
MRAFLALDLSNSFGKAVEDTIKKLKESGVHASFVRSEQVHLTLAFFEDIPEMTAQEITRELKERFAQNRLQIFVSLGNLGVFPDRKQPRLIWREIVEKGGALHNLKRTVDAALRSFGFPVEGRTFKPHLTIARIKERHSAGFPESIFQPDFSPPLTGPTLIKELAFFKSVLTPSGPIYSVISRIPLA